MCMNETANASNTTQRSTEMKTFPSAGDLLASPSPSTGGDASDYTCSSSLDGSATSCEEEDSSRRSGLTPTPHAVHRRHKLLRRQSSMQEAGMHLTAGTIVSIAVVVFSLFFPFVSTPTAARETYQFAFWKYDPELSHFDNTLWTYGTDYFLAVCLLFLGASIKVTHPSFANAGWRSRGLLACYMFSVIAGGLAHQFYTTVEERNTLSFRLLWTVCVGTVAAASGFMGAAGTELLRLDHAQNPHETFLVPVIPDWFWVGYACSVTATVAYGGFSCHRPACDIFIAGITQFPSTFYVIGILFCQLRRYKRITNTMRIVGCIGFILNAPLLPLYPILVQYTDWSLASVNTLLHSWLLVAWSLQGLCLRHVGNAVIAASSSKRD